MGNSSSAQSTVKNTVESIIGVYTDTIQTCQSRPANIVEIQQVNSQGDNIISGADIKQYISVDMTCIQDAKVSSEAEQQIKEKIKNASESITGAIAFMSSASSNSITESLTKLETKIQTEFKQQLQLLSLNQINIKQINIAGNNIITNLNIEQMANVIGNSVQTAVMESKVKTDLDKQIDASAKATVKGLEDCLWQLLILAIIGLVIYMMVSGMAGGAMNNTTIMLIILTLATGYMAMAYTWDGKLPYFLFPEKKNKRIAFYVLLGICIVCSILLVMKLRK